MDDADCEIAVMKVMEYATTGTKRSERGDPWSAGLPKVFSFKCGGEGEQPKIKKPTKKMSIKAARAKTKRKFIQERQKARRLRQWNNLRRGV